MMFGIKEAGIAAAFGGQGKGWLIVLLIVIVLFSVGGALGPGLLAQTVPSSSSTSGPAVNPSEPVFDAQGNIVPAGTLNNASAGGSGVVGSGTANFGTNLAFTLFNPKVLGVLFLFVLGAMTIVLLNQT